MYIDKLTLTYIWAFEQWEIIEAKIQVKLMKLAKDLTISEGNANLP